MMFSTILRVHGNALETEKIYYYGNNVHERWFLRPYSSWIINYEISCSSKDKEKCVWAKQ